MVPYIEQMHGARRARGLPRPRGQDRPASSVFAPKPMQSLQHVHPSSCSSRHLSSIREHIIPRASKQMQDFARHDGEGSFSTFRIIASFQASEESKFQNSLISRSLEQPSPKSSKFRTRDQVGCKRSLPGEAALAANLITAFKFNF